MAGLSSELASSAGGDAAQLAFARVIARDRAVKAASQALAFLLAQALIQVAALALSNRIATRSLAAEFARMRALIGDQERRLAEAAALSGWKEVASFLSHQLKNPLAAIDLCHANAREAAARLRPGGAAGGILGQSLDAIGEETARMKALVARLKSLTAFEEPRFSCSELGVLARKVCGSFTPERLAAAIEGNAGAWIDPDLASQALRNLLDNSVEEAEKAGRAPVRVRISIRREGGASVIALDDSNTGMTAGLAARLGRERFTSKRTGSGLGLLFVSRIMSIHSGAFRAEATESGSLRVELSFPSEEPPGERGVGEGVRA